MTQAQMLDKDLGFKRVKAGARTDVYMTAVNYRRHVPVDLYILAILLGILAIPAMTLLLYTHTNFFRRKSNNGVPYEYAALSKGVSYANKNSPRPKSTFIEGDNRYSSYNTSKYIEG